MLSHFIQGLEPNIVLSLRYLNAQVYSVLSLYLPCRQEPTDFDNITDEEIKKFENQINNRSMKVLGWESPNEFAAL